MTSAALSTKLAVFKGAQCPTSLSEEFTVNLAIRHRTALSEAAITTNLFPLPKRLQNGPQTLLHCSIYDLIPTTWESTLSTGLL